MHPSSKLRSSTGNAVRFDGISRAKSWLVIVSYFGCQDCAPDQPNHSFQPYAVFIEDMTVAAKAAALASFGKKQLKYDSYH